MNSKTFKWILSNFSVGFFSKFSMDEQKNMKKNSSFEEQMLLNPKLFKNPKRRSNY